MTSKRLFHFSMSFLIALLFLTSLFAKNGMRDYWRVRRLVNEKVSEIEELQKTNTHITNEIKLLTSNKDYFERLAREELGLVRKNEIIYIFKDLKK